MEEKQALSFVGDAHFCTGIRWRWRLNSMRSEKEKRLRIIKNIKQIVNHSQSDLGMMNEGTFVVEEITSSGDILGKKIHFI